MAQTIDPIVRALLDETKPARDEHRKRIKRFDECYSVYRAIPTQPTVAKDNLSRVRVALAMQTIDTAMVNMTSGAAPRAKVTARTPDWEQNEQAFQRVMDYFADRDHLAEKEPTIIQPGLIFGLTVGKCGWTEKSAIQIQHTLGTDGQVTAKPFEGIGYRGPTLEVWDPYECWWDPDGRDVDSCRYFTLRSWLTKEDLLRAACTTPGDHARDKCNGIYHNVKELIDSGPAGSRRDYTAQEMFLGSQGNVRKNRYEVCETWRDDRVTVIGNNSILLRDDPNPHFHGKKPIVAAYTRPDLHKLQGIPETELIDHIQQAFWTHMNLRLESEHLTVWRAFTYREGGVVDPDGIEIKPRALIGVTDHEDLKPILTQPLPAEAFREEESLLGLLQMVTGVSPFISGAQMSGVDQNTATGVSVLSEVASRLLRFKASLIRRKIWTRVFEMWGSDIQQFMDETLWIRLTGPGGDTEWRPHNPAEIAGEYDFELEGSDDAISKQQDRNDALALLNALAPYAQQGLVNPAPLLENLARQFGIADPKSILAPAPQTPPGAGPFGPNGQPPTPGNPQEVLPGQASNSQIDPRVMQQMVAAMGLNRR